MKDFNINPPPSYPKPEYIMQQVKEDYGEMTNEERWLFIQKYWSSIDMHWTDGKEVLLGAIIKLDFSGEADKQKMFCEVFDKHVVEKVNEQKKGNTND